MRTSLNQPEHHGAHHRSAEAPRRRALLCVNPASRTGALGTELADAVLRAGDIHLVEARCDRAADLPARILAHRDEVDCVIIAGGDGTMNAAGPALLETGLPLGVLPTGTANDFARSLGIPTALDAAARVIVEGRTRQIDIGSVNGHHFLNVASVGLAAELAQSLTSERKRRFGRLSYALTALRLLLQAKPFRATLLISGEEIEVRTMQIAVGNGRFYGGGNVVARDARIDDGILDLYSLEFSQIWRLALMLPTFKSGAHGMMREVRTARGGSFRVLTRRPRSVNADGELVTKTPALFTQQAAALEVYVPGTSPLVTASV